ncbi:MAG TPA: ATP-dependent RecD-like DNA helicase [Clostridiales bacterium]|nr:ATP-dependent RecD-like DNA helicase [Clostridiales bacterium]
MQEKGKLLELTGEVEDIIYRNESNGYTVLELLSGDESVTAVGIMPMANIGEELKLIGKYKSHSSYGEQFAVDACERSMPTSSGAILKYLSSGAIKGIGPTTARRMVEAFGENTLEVIEKEPQRLTTLKGITDSKAKKINEEMQKIFGVREVMVELSRYGISASHAVQVWKLYGSKALEMVNENPYVLCVDGLNIPFETADSIAVKQEMPSDNVCRIRAGLTHILEHNKNNGHTCLPMDRLVGACSNFLGVESDKTNEAIKDMITDGTVICDTVREKDFIFLPYMHQCETYISARMLMLMRFPAQQLTGIDKAINAIEAENNITYADLQKQAISQALTKGMLILTGGPGTGKTTTLNAIIKILRDNGEKVALAAPTGRAAQRMSQVTGCEAKTLHRLLEVAWDKQDNPVFMKNEKNLLECDALIIDELSMVDSMLFESVMRAFPMGCRLIMVGDCDQLPSVGAGNVLGDLIASQMLPVIQLNEIFRQSMESLIVTNAHAIVQGNMPNLTCTSNDFFFMNRSSQNDISSTIVDLCKNRLPRSYGYSPLNDIQVLCPSRKGELGTYNINKKLQQMLNPPDTLKKEVNINGNILRTGDKVMQVKNNYDIPWVRDNGEGGEGVFNGDIGILSQINKGSQSLKVVFDDKVAVYTMESATDLELAYAVTVHKSQGNEFTAVVIPMFPGPPQLSYRNLLYTAVTRAKKLLILVGLPKALKHMVENNRKTLRYSAVKDFLLRGR